ncbi:MAG: SDR family NAD(P)-dependent oxidoreductase [Blastochloris sp.]|nr:SDR family NAD(P)-dependent oxidoreductase [Blastochloris sp.]
MKALRSEWVDGGIRMVDCGEELDWEECGRLLLKEWPGEGADWMEVVYRGGRRTTWRPENAEGGPWNEGESRRLPQGAVIVATGGLRGITAEAALRLARSYDGRLHLLSRTVWQEGRVPRELKHLKDAVELRRGLIELWRGMGRTVEPGMIEREVQEIGKQREIRESMDRLEKAGVKYCCHQVDVRDEKAMKRVLAEIYAQEGRIDVVLHGAGVIEDKLLGNKTEEVFDRVYETKVKGARWLEENLRWAELNCVVLFSSVSAYVGNRGQTDYAAANACLNALGGGVAREIRGSGVVAGLEWLGGGGGRSGDGDGDGGEEIEGFGGGDDRS